MEQWWKVSTEVGQRWNPKPCASGIARLQVLESSLLSYVRVGPLQFLPYRGSHVKGRKERKLSRRQKRRHRMDN